MSLIAGILWRFTTRPMFDTPGYRAAAQTIRQGWPHLLDRTPGYPLVLLATSSAERSTVVLFLVQTLMHATCVLLVVDAVRFTGVGRRGRIAVAVLLMAPPVLLRVVYEGTEALSALLITVLFWLLVVTGSRPMSHRRATVVGLICGVLPLVRPTFALLALPVAVVVALRARPSVAHVASTFTVALLPAVLLVGSLSVYNGVRFDSFGLTPLFPYHLNSRTSTYVENLPSSYEPARSVLIKERDRALVRGESYAPANYIWEAKDDLARVTGKSGRELDRYVLQIDLELISNNPFSYLDTVTTALVNITTMDSQPAVLGMGRSIAHLEQALHLLLSIVFLVTVGSIPGLALAGLVPRRTYRFLGAAILLVGYTVLTSAAIETGTARLRAPVEPILAGVLVVAASLTLHQVRIRRMIPGVERARSSNPSEF